jgi:hypothetical protein
VLLRAAGDSSRGPSTLRETLSLGVLCQTGSMKAEMMMMVIIIIVVLMLKDEPEDYMIDI